MRRVYETIVAVEKQEVLHISVCVRVRGALWRVRTHARTHTEIYPFYKTRAIFVYKTIPTMVRFYWLMGTLFVSTQRQVDRITLSHSFCRTSWLLSKIAPKILPNTWALFAIHPTKQWEYLHPEFSNISDFDCFNYFYMSIIPYWEY